MFRILIAEDNDSQRKIMEAFLSINGYEIYACPDAQTALDAASRTHIDLCIVDIMMPGMDGYALTRALRTLHGDMPILMVTARAEFSDKREGFEAGVDDYMVKPVDLDELLLRVRALFRRAHIQTAHKITLGDAVLDSNTFTLTYQGESLDLKRKEFGLLFMLLSYPDKLLTRRQLMDEVWGPDCDTDERTVDVHIKRLREKLRGVTAFSIVTVRGVGYRAEVHHA